MKTYVHAITVVGFLCAASSNHRMYAGANDGNASLSSKLLLALLYAPATENAHVLRKTYEPDLNLFVAMPAMEQPSNSQSSAGDDAHKILSRNPFLQAVRHGLTVKEYENWQAAQQLQVGHYVVSAVPPAHTGTGDNTAAPVTRGKKDKPKTIVHHDEDPQWGMGVTTVVRKHRTPSLGKYFNATTPKHEKEVRKGRGRDRRRYYERD